MDFHRLAANDAGGVEAEQGIVHRLHPVLG